MSDHCGRVEVGCMFFMEEGCTCSCCPARVPSVREVLDAALARNETLQQSLMDAIVRASNAETERDAARRACEKLRKGSMVNDQEWSTAVAELRAEIARLRDVLDDVRNPAAKRRTGDWKPGQCEHGGYRGILQCPHPGRLYYFAPDDCWFCQEHAPPNFCDCGHSDDVHDPEGCKGRVTEAGRHTICMCVSATGERSRTSKG